MQYTKFNHRPEQKFAFDRKPKIRVLSKLGFEELMKNSSNPVQFQVQEMMTLDPFTKKYRPQISLQEKFDQVEPGLSEEGEEIEFTTRDHPYILQNHAYPVNDYQEPKNQQLSVRLSTKSEIPKLFESSLFSGARITMQNRKQQRLAPLRLAGSLSLKHFNDLHPSYDGILQKLNRAVNFDNNQFKFQNE